MKSFDNTSAYSRQVAITDSVSVIGISAIAFGIEVGAADALPWGEEARGVIAVLTGAVTALGLTRLRGRPLGDLGFRRPARWWPVCLWVPAIILVYLIAQAAVPAALSTVFELPDADMSRYDNVRGNLGAAVMMALLLPITASIPEEILYRGFLIERFACLAGRSNKGWLVAVIAQAVVFGLVHFQWGAGGILMTTIMGLVWGIAYLLCGRNLWILIIAHSTLHLLLVAQLYLS